MQGYELETETLLVHQLVEAQVERSPEAIAIEFANQQLTYQQLNQRANQLADYLRELGVGSNRIVAICMERSFDLIIAVLATLKTGAAYLPLDCSYPADRINFMLKDAQALLLTQSHLSNRLSEQTQTVCLDLDAPAIASHCTANLDIQATPDDLAYVIYTSGTTGRPKGVTMPHRPLVNLLEWQLQQSSPDLKTLQFTPISFDVSFQEIFATLAGGGTLVLVAEETRRDPFCLLRLLQEQSIERLFLPFVALQHLAEAAKQSTIVPASLRQVITAGEQLRITTAIADWFTHLPACTLHNQYGPSESHVVTAFTLSGSPQSWEMLPPIGYPIPNAEIQILDAEQHPVDPGMAGELYIGGVMASGYLNRPDLTASRFVEHPFRAGRLYRTGDLARFRQDGAIEYLGRIDQQVKIRGFRIEPGEIEAVLEQAPIVQKALVMAREDRPGNRYLAAYIILDAAHDLDRHDVASKLRYFLDGQLPEYMIPRAFVVLDRFPLTPSGKIDRSHLPVPSYEFDAATFIAPQTQTETAIAAIWAEVLGLQVSTDQDFLELGGDSLLAVQVVSRLRERLRVELPLSDLLTASTVQQLAKTIEKMQQQGQEMQLAPIQRVSRSAPLPLTYMQEPLWFLDQLAPNNPFYNVPEAFRLKGVLDAAALEQCFQVIIDRHEVLRTTFTTQNGEPVQVIHPAPCFKLPVVDLVDQSSVATSSVTSSAVVKNASLLRKIAKQLHRTVALPASAESVPDVNLPEEVPNWEWIVAEARRPFDLSQDLLLRATLFKLNETDHILFINQHHLVCDGWSISVLWQELAALYTAFTRQQSYTLPDLSIQYADFTLWHRQWIQQERQRQLAYWRQQLSDLPFLSLPTDAARPPVSTYRGARHFLSLSSSLTAALQALSRQEGSTLFMTLLAAFQTLLYRYTGQDDIPVGSLVANRHRPELEKLLGFFANTIVLRTDLSGSPSFRQLLQRVRSVTLAAYAHQDLPFEQLVRSLQPDRDLNQNPLVQVVFNLQNTPASTWDVPGLSLSHLPLDNQTVKFDLFLEFTETPNGLTGYFEYSTDLFTAPTIARFAAQLQTLLENIASQPDQSLLDIDLMPPAEQQQLLNWNKTQAEIPPQCVHQLFEVQAACTPHAIAIEFAGKTLTYGELNQQANQLAHHLQALGVQPDVVVGICIERSPALVVGLLGILKAGGAYVPLDPSYPKERLAYMLSDSQAPVLVTQQSLLEQLPQHSAQTVCIDADWQQIAAHSLENPQSAVTHDNLIYLLYTSGSTGRPKGVQLRHRGLANLLQFMRQQPGLSERDICFAVSSISFDIAEVEIHLPLIVGARIYLVSRAVAADAAQLAKTLDRSGATFMQATPASWQLLLAAGWQGNRNLKIVTCGEALNRTLADQLLPRVYGLWNMYAPTETTIHATIYRMQPESPVLIGKPIPNMQFYICNQHSTANHSAAPKLVPIGVPGEVYIGGAGVARGYLNRPDLTEQKFVDNPFGQGQLYRTGDLARYRPDGNLEFIGRIDNQVKIRGFRIELGEVEATLNQSPAVQEAIVIAREDQPGDKRLVAYVVPSVDASSDLPDAAATAHTKQLQQWQTIWNHAYQQSPAELAAADPAFNTITWNSSYTQLPIPSEQMQEWVERTVERILALQPQRVLELGCGMGLLLFRIAPSCSHYFGLDLSQTAIDYIQQQIQLQGNSRDWAQVQLATGSADALERFEPASFDTVILNSVVQYFPGVDYLVQVLEQAVSLIKPGGHLFIGDVRSLPLLTAFHASVQFYQATADLPIAQLQQRIQDAVEQDKELVIDPAFFLALQQHLPQISQVEIQLKRGQHHNEMTQFRYDVTLHVSGVDGVIEPVTPSWQEWHPEWTVAAIRQQLETAKPQVLGVAGVKNSRLLPVLAQLAATETETVGELRSLNCMQPAGIDPEDFWNLTENIPYNVHINWSNRADGSYDVVFVECSVASVPMFATEKPSSPKSWHSYTNRPYQAKSMPVQQLRSFLQQTLPEFMVPSAFVVMDALPRTPNGKVNRRSLPAPNRERPNLKADFVAPRTMLETRLTEIWRQVLGIDQVGVADNFFELGGHSLLAAQMLALVQAAFAVEFSLLNIFLSPTIAGLAQIVSDRLSGATVNVQPMLDLEAEAILDPAIVPPDASVGNIAVNEPENILLTGATGFLGAFLLHELLEQTSANIYCLVRATDAQAARQRLQANLQHYSLWDDSRSSRIVPVLGDLSQPRLGLSAHLFDVLSDVDAIYHNGGLVNFIYPYSVLKAANVLSTQEVLRLASRTKLKPVHFISSLGVFSPVAYQDGQLIRDEVPDRSEGLYGYTQSKWVAEKLMAIAQSRGIPTTIHRPAWIEGHSQTGVCNRSDFLRGLIKGCIQLGIAPDWRMPIDLTPVDFISRAIVCLSQQQSLIGQAFNFANPHSLTWIQLVDWMQTFGYAVKLIPYEQWLSEVVERVEDQPNHALYPFLAFLTEHIPEQQKTVPEMYFQTNSIHFDTQNVVAGLADMNMVYPAVDDALLTAYFSYFIRSGFLESPNAVPAICFVR